MSGASLGKSSGAEARNVCAGARTGGREDGSGAPARGTALLRGEHVLLEGGQAAEAGEGPPADGAEVRERRGAALAEEPVDEFAEGVDRGARARRGLARVGASSLQPDDPQRLLGGPAPPRNQVDHEDRLRPEAVHGADRDRVDLAPADHALAPRRERDAQAGRLELDRGGGRHLEPARVLAEVDRLGAAPRLGGRGGLEALRDFPGRLLRRARALARLGARPALEPLEQVLAVLAVELVELGGGERPPGGVHREGGIEVGGGPRAGGRDGDARRPARAAKRGAERSRGLVVPAALAQQRRQADRERGLGVRVEPGRYER